MDKLLNQIGKDARRITFCIQNESNYYLLYSVIELLLPDMCKSPMQRKVS